MSILEMHFEVVHTQRYIRSVKFARAIFAFDPRVIAILGVWRLWSIRAKRKRLIGISGDGSVAHCPFKEVFGVSGLEVV